MDVDIIEKGIYKIRGKEVKLDFEIANELKTNARSIRKVVKDNINKFSDAKDIQESLSRFLLENSDVIPKKKLLSIWNNSWKIVKILSSSYTFKNKSR